jgi:formylglycine-generating enzyme required for sulfatase activity
MVYLPKGKFVMGDDKGRGIGNEAPVHEVELGAFAIGKYPVTIGEYMRFVEATQSHYPEWLEEGSKYHIETGSDDHYRNKDIGIENKDCPIVGISWEDAGAYCEWLSEQTHEIYELPTEAEWEYACRAGSKTDYCFGDDPKLLTEYAWYSENSEGKLHAAGEKQPNEWGLHDMHGNVWEWVGDWYAEYSKQLQSDDSDNSSETSGNPSATLRNPSGPVEGSDRVIRGGGWVNDAGYCRSACRRRRGPAARDHGLGFRLSRKV